MPAEREMMFALSLQDQTKSRFLYCPDRPQASDRFRSEWHRRAGQRSWL